MKPNPMKKRLIFLYKLLRTKTDERHQISTKQIMEELKAAGLSADRKTLKSDLDLLYEAGADIIVVRSSPNRYFWGERTFQLPELKLLIDAVSSSRFITAKKSEELIRKLVSLASGPQASELDRHVFAANRVKTDNEKIYYIVDSINDAINAERKICFQYLEYTGNKEKIPRNNGERYCLSPYALYWNDDYYYVVGYSDKRDKVTAFRVDRICNCEITGTPREPRPADFDVTDYSRRVFEMFDGEDVVVELECENALMKYVIDRFGEEVETRVISEDAFVARVEVALSPTFYGWVFQFSGKIKILTPDKAREEYVNMAKAAAAGTEPDGGLL